VFCYDSAPYTAYLDMDGVTSNAVSFGSAGSGGGGSTGAGSGPGGTAPGAGSGSGANPVNGGGAPGHPVAGHGYCWQTDQSVFYSPGWVSTGMGGNGHPTPAQCNLTYGLWAGSGGCSAANTVADTPTSATTLTGWSLGRVGLSYFLAAAGRDRVARVSRIVLIDPGPTSEIAGSCEDTHIRKHYHTTTSALFADWLSSSSSNHLVILTGRSTEDRGASPNPLSASFHGLKTYYLAEIHNKKAGVKDRVLWCDYNDANHWDIFWRYYHSTRNAPSGCPIIPNEPSPKREQP
jgi:hypothetical protein